MLGLADAAEHEYYTGIPKATEKFSTEPDTYMEPETELSGRALTGLILGFGATGIFLLYAGVAICQEEKKRG